MFTRSFIVVSAMLLACAPESTELRVQTPASEMPDGYTLTGDLPADIDLHHAMDQLSPNGFAVFGTPGSADVAILSHSEAAGDRGIAGPATFTAGAASCTDCGDATCASSTRTVAIDLTHAAGDLQEHTTVTSSASNFAGPAPFVFTPTLGGTTTVTIPGTLPLCAAFSYYFDVELTGGVNPVVRAPAAAGELVITEIMKNPNITSDADGEWFELVNTTGDTLELENCVVRDDGSNNATIDASFQIAPGGIATVAGSASPGFTPDFVIDSLQLANGDDEVIVECAALVIDEVFYTDADFPDTGGASMQVVPGSNATDNDDGTNWCNGSADYNGGDLGSPGGANTNCP